MFLPVLLGKGGNAIPNAVIRANGAALNQSSSAAMGMTIFKLLDLQSDLPIEIGCATYVLSRI